MKSNVYDIIYRNDSNIRGLLEENLMFSETGFIAFWDADGEIWYFYKRAGILVPGQQNFDRMYGARDALSGNRKIKIGEEECDCGLPTEDCAKDFFSGLSRISACDDWRIDRQLWEIAGASSALYDAPIRMVRPKQFMDRVSTLRCVYVKDQDTDRRNFTSFEHWEYIDSYEKMPNGKIAVQQKLSASETRSEEMPMQREIFRVSPIWKVEPEDAADREKASGVVSAEEILEAELEKTINGGTVTDTDVPAETEQEEELPQEATPEKSVEQETKIEEIQEQNVSQKAVSGGAVLPKRKKNVNDIRELLDCDKRRCRLESYDEDMLYDIKRGHWDLFGCTEDVEIPGKGKLVQRDPRKDIKTGIVGIDFGTKSTVVVRQDDTSAIIPIRIGAEALSAEIRENDYENPTIIECADLDKFIKKYYEQDGRPKTSCDDFFISYDAYKDYRSCPPNEFYAYYADLKQWANHEKENIIIWDKKRHEYRFGAVGSEKENIINPIELYAYYIGMYINNMRNGIYMKYLMSFPVGYSKETRQLIVSSFERGIRKSLPTCILEDEECMKDFSVQLGISEPAAYAVTALEMSELEPEDENDKYRYGIFDFGGGTADFGFGIWRGASEEEYEVEGYDYVLECFGADSDVMLGGEKILELLAYDVFKKNKTVAREKRITCSLPFGENAFMGSETLISDSQIARRNMFILKEELRPLWHQEENWEKKYRHETGNGAVKNGAGYEEYIEPALYDIDGNMLSDCRFAVDTQSLISLIKARIQKGIDAFFKCMGKAFQKEGKLADYDGQIYIFLAGNSSRSIFVRELFEETIKHYSSKNGGPSFILSEPMNEENGDEYVPNGKTSVAYGLIKSREGSSVKVEKNFETDAEEQTRFKYYLGRERRRHFDCRLSPGETEYGEWIRFQGAVKRTVRIYYTTDPTADVREEPPVIDNIPYKEIMIDPQKEAYLFIRACEPTVIEYTVACSEEAIGAENEIRRIEF